MANPNKNQGTRYERETKEDLIEDGFQVRRLAEEGIYDKGDLLVLGFRDAVVECRAREVMQVHRALQKAKTKAGILEVALFWKRLVKVPGKKNRQPVDGQAEVVVIDPEFFKVLLHAYQKEMYTRGD